MSTATKPLPAHGTYARSVGRPAYGIKGCSCPPCGKARKTYRHRRDLLKAAGRDLLVPAGPAIAHLHHLRAEQAGWDALRRATGCSGSTISHLLRGDRTVIRRSVANAVLNVQLAQVLPPSRPVNAIGSVRRIQAAMAIGHYCYDIADACHVDKSVIVHILNGHLDSVRADTADKIRAGYATLCTRPGSSTRSRRRALREGWHGPMAWDSDIDDPNAAPDTADPADLDRGELAELRSDEILHLASWGVTPERICARLNNEVSISHVRGIVRAYRTGKKRDRKQAAA